MASPTRTTVSISGDIKLAVDERTVARKQYTLPFRVDFALLQRALSALFYAAVIYLALLLMPVSMNPVEPGTDPGWIYGLNYLWAHGITFGKDVSYTYGPWGFVVAPQQIGANLAVGNMFRLLIWGLLLWQLIGLWRTGRRLPGTILLASIIITNGLYSFVWEYSVMLVIVVLLVRLFDNPTSTLNLALLGLLCGSLFLIKFSSFFLAAPVVLLFGIHRLTVAPRVTSRKELALLAFCLVSGPLFYLAYHASVSDLFRYIIGGFNFSAGHGVAMAIDTPPREMFFALVLGLTLAAVIAYSLYTRIIPIAAAAMAVMMGWAVFKHGFMRCDAAHPVIFFLFSVVIFGFVISLAQLNLKTGVRLLTVFLVYSLIALNGKNNTFPTWTRSWWLPEGGLARLELLWNWNQSVQRLGTPAGKNSDLPPAFAADVRGKRVLVLPTDLSYAAFYNFDLVPLYALQAYAAYTPYLDKMSAEHIGNNINPIDFALFDWKDGDSRHPILDIPATWKTLFENYSVARSTSRSLLLQHRQTPLRLTYSPLANASWEPGQWIPVPKSAQPVMATVDLSPKISGSLITALYKLPYVFMEVRTLTGAVEKLRIVPSLLSSPFLTNALPLSGFQLADLWGKNVVRDPITELRFIGDGLEYLHHGPLQFMAVGGSGISVADRPTVDNLSSLLNVADIAQISDRNSEGAVDVVNGVVSPAPDNRASPVHVRIKDGVAIQGWIVMGPARSGKTFDEVYGVANGMVVKAASSDRNDVASYHKNPHINMCGYHFQLGSALLREGLQAVDIVGVDRSQNKIVRLPTSTFIFGE